MPRRLGHPPSGRLSLECLESRTLLAVTFAVNSFDDAPDANPGDGSAEDALGRTTLRAAVMEANALGEDSTIELGPGSHLLSLGGPESDATNDLDVTGRIRLVATGGGPTVVAGNGSDRVFEVHSRAALALEGIMISGGSTADEGGGILNAGGSVELLNTTLAGNEASLGGGIANHGQLKIDSSTVSGNIGGGIVNTGNAVIHHSTITGNVYNGMSDSMADGFANQATAAVANTIIAGNADGPESRDVSGSFMSLGHNLIGNAGMDPEANGFQSAYGDIVGTSQQPIDARLAPLTDNGGTSYTHSPLAGSPAIDNGWYGPPDDSGNGHIATFVGDVTIAEGRVGRAARLPTLVVNNTSSFIEIEVERIAADSIPTAAMTIAAWLEISVTGFRQTIFNSRSGDGTYLSHVEITPEGKPRFAVRNAAGEFIVDVEAGSVPFGEWFHYAATYDQAANEVVLYINGTAVFTGAATLNQPIGGNWDSGARIGARLDSATSGTRPLSGRLDEFYIFHRALGSEEISLLAAPAAEPTTEPLITGDVTLYYSFDEGIASSTDQRSGVRMLDGDGIAGPRLDIGAVERVNDFNPDDPISEKIQPGSITVRVERIATGLISPSLVIHAADGSGRLFVVDQIGLVHVIVDGQLQTEPFLDVTDVVQDTLNGNDERGLSGLAFHPGFAEPLSPGYGKFYTWADELYVFAAPVDFTHYPLRPGQRPAAQSVLREWTMDRTTDNEFSGTSRELLRVDQPHQAHSAGSAEFGPDGYLYLSLGDGGTHDDQGPGHNPETGNAQDPTNIYGSVLRIDPLGNNSANGKYGIPEDNPFAGDPAALDEIYFYGLRNPFRFSFELDRHGRKTHRLIIGDTGQDDIEEVDLADTLTQAGGNFGWNMKEGTFIFDPGPPPDPSPELRIGVTADSPGWPLGLIDPAVQYDHGANGEGSAVLGGFVYQGTAIPQLRGKYVFGDFHRSAPGVSGPNGRIFYTDLNADPPQILELQLDGELLSTGTGVAIYIKGFGVDEQGELLVAGSTTLASADHSGVVLRLQAVSPPVVGDMDIDGDADMDDLDDFVLALRSAEAYEALHGVPPSTYGDTDGDGDFDFDDIPEFVRSIEEAGG